ncbi:recombinase family protein [Dactylosporangium roseum]|uniref:Recombinase family protein n=1 Tax=Dactylosporangium roseum TaxID=47989 RepID=A0ABY5ZGD5_9ACTN|nr:recombinase family protein [Dactylosporangium roseum]UWZ39768.1 recombinase family protein [Dactylosporangium roseum]
MIRFAFCGRCSTEDQQDPESSRSWQLSRATALVEPRGGVIVAEYFDIGQSRSLPWPRRPRARLLLEALADPQRGFGAVVIGEPHRAFYGNQFGLTFPLFTHYGVTLWVPEVGGPLDPDNEAHDLVMSVFGGMSKGERNRIKIRVRTAMAAQTKIEGRFLGGRPPYGYRLVDAGPHPNPAKAADGKRLHRLDLDPDTAPVVAQIFTSYLAGRGIFAIAEELTRERIPCPSAHDPQRNRHRSGIAWSKMAIRVILTNPRYTGRQVWNRQRKDEVLLDVNDVAMGHRTKQVWNDIERWIWSDNLAHPAIVDTDIFEQVQAKIATKGASTKTVKPRRTPRPYLFRGALICGICQRRMQGHWLRDAAYYRCRFPTSTRLPTSSPTRATSTCAKTSSPNRSTTGCSPPWHPTTSKPPSTPRTPASTATPSRRSTNRSRRSCRNATGRSPTTGLCSTPVRTRPWSQAGSPRPPRSEPLPKRATAP